MEIFKLENPTRIGAEVEKKIWSRLRDHVKKVHGGIKGYLSKELNEAIDLYLRVQSGELIVMNADYKEQNLIKKDSLVEKFKEYFNDHKEISSKELMDFVEWLGYTSESKFYFIRKQLKAKGCIEPVNGTKNKVFKVLFQDNAIEYLNTMAGK